MKTIKFVLVAMITLAALIVSARAGQASLAGNRVAPRSVVLSLYNQHKRRSPFYQTRSRALLDKFFTGELADMIWHDAITSRGEVGALGADPLYNAQDTQIRKFAVRERSAQATTAEVVAAFENFNEKREILFRMELVGTSWKISDIVYDEGYTLAGLLRANADPARNAMDVKVYLVALGDNGKSGKKIGCEDSLVPVTRSIMRTSAPLKAALSQLLATPPHPAANPKLENFWKGNNLKVKSVAIRNGTATIHISGEVFVAGICDIPRIESQIEETARQFPNVKRVKVFIGRRTLQDAIR